MNSDPNSVWFILPMAAIPFFITGLIGNVLVIRIVHKTRDMHTTTNYLLANLAVGDVISILCLFPSFLIFNQLDYVGEKFVCKFLVIGGIPLFCSSLTLTVLAVERYHALLKPFRTGLRLKKDNIKQAIAVIWITSVAICLPGFFLNEWSEKYSSCVTHKVYVLIMCVVSTYIPTTVFLYCYGSLIKGLYFSYTICDKNTGEERNDSAKKKLVITFILATAGFVIGYGPIAIFHTVNFSGDEEHISFKFSKLSGVFYFMFFCSLCLNPILYAFRSTNYREGFKRIIFCRKQPSQNDMQMS